jgi:hypothetical protein
MFNPNESIRIKTSKVSGQSSHKADTQSYRGGRIDVIEEEKDSSLDIMSNLNKSSASGELIRVTSNISKNSTKRVLEN